MARLIETIPFQYNIIESNLKGTKSDMAGILMRIEGKCQHVGKKNANGRVYPPAIFETVLNDEAIKERLEAREIVGQLDHPDSGVSSAALAACVLTKHYMKEDGEVYGGFDILDTPMGNIAAKLFEAKVRLGVSSRGDGSVIKENDADVVQDDYVFETYDLVLKPSTYGAYPNVVESITESTNNDKAIGQVLESIIDNNTDTNVLLECNKIVGLLPSDHRRLTEKIVTKLNSNNVSISDTKTISNNQISEENEMLTEEAKKLFESKDVIAYIKEQVDSQLNEAVDSATSEISGLNKRIVELTGINEMQSKRLKAAEDIIDACTLKLKELKEHKTTDLTLKKRYEASVKLLNAALKKLNEHKSTKKRLTTAEQLLKQSLVHHKQSKVQRYIDQATATLPENLKSSFRSLLSECKTTKQVDKKLVEVKALFSKLRESKRKEPLPRRTTKVTRGRSLTESKRNKKFSHSDSIVDGLLKKFE